MVSDTEKKGPDLARGVPIADLVDGKLLGGTFGGEAVVVVNDGGRLCAFSGKCTHLDAPLADGLVVDGTVRCPWHHARFSLVDGEAVGAPAFEPLSRYDIEVRDGHAFVTGMQEAPGPAARKADDRVPKRIVIVGGGAGGHACAEMLARSGFGERVTVVSDDTDRPYDRTFCSKQYLAGKAERDECFVADASFYGDGGPTLLLGREATAIDVEGRQVVLDDGRRLPYDALVLAMGADALLPEGPGFDGHGVHVLRTLKDADALIAAAQPGTRAVVIGASFIGLEAAASLTQREVVIEVVAPEHIPLKKIVGAHVGAMIRDVHEEKGVRFHLSREARSWDGATLTLDDGSTIAADFVVAGIGIAPRTELAKAAGLMVASDDDGGGVVVDAHLVSSVPGIYAIGDIARYPDRDAGAELRVEHWVHAQRQGQFVARHLMGEADRYGDLPFFWSAHFDTGLRYLGHVDAIDEAHVDGSIEGRDFTIRYAGRSGSRAYATCNRDLPALEVEAEWERTPATP